MRIKTLAFSFGRLLVSVALLSVIIYAGALHAQTLPADTAPAADSSAATTPTTAPAEKAVEPVQILNLLGPTFDRTPYWGWLGLLGAIFLGLIAGKIAGSILRAAAGKLQRRGWEGRGVAFENAANPASLALLTFALTAGMQLIYLEEPLRLLTNRCIQFLYLLSVAWLLFNLVDVVDLALRKVTGRTNTKLDDMVVPLVRKTLRIFLVVVFTLVAAQNVFGLNITGWLAGLGIAGLAVSLAAQDSIKNLFGSLTVFFDKPFLVRDVITFDGETGTVEEIGFRSTRIRLFNGHLVTVPNMQFIDRKVENISARHFIRREMNVTITYDTPPEKIQEAIAILHGILHEPQVVEAGRFDLKGFPPRVAFNELNADSLNLKATYWYQLAGDSERNWFTYLEHCQLVNLKLFQHFAQADIEFAFPTQTLYLAGDPKRRLAVSPTPDNP
ncbi:MAG: mechanosensitive ion channel family protein [Phycisphaeraceae bacterium]|nr:mechanosensitive ion channel family protein [Phycisphaeraceae bacterium]